MDSKGRALDNVFVERLWRTIKYEEVYLKDYRTMREAQSSLKAFINLCRYGPCHSGQQYGRKHHSPFCDRTQKLALLCNP
ncbi:hypothetical protein [uncultured Desulfobacter sp.]|uniref:hypothetical protein n=1 Tax=uncultured Desulfobacter sp. TaxID=240139 RepID=UPI00374A6B56